MAACVCDDPPKHLVVAPGTAVPGVEDALELLVDDEKECVHCNRLTDGNPHFVEESAIQDAITGLQGTPWGLDAEEARNVLCRMVLEQEGHLCVECFDGLWTTLKPQEVDDFLRGAR